LKERTFVVQAHIVKVMKAQKQYRFQNVVTDVIRNITMFRADPKMVKEQIEVLIRDEYMKRDDNDRANLIYIP
jgi:cullin 1